MTRPFQLMKNMSYFKLEMKRKIMLGSSYTTCRKICKNVYYNRAVATGGARGANAPPIIQRVP